MKKTLSLMAVSMLLLPLVQGCAVNPVTGKSQLMLVSESQEVQMGKEFYPSAMWGDMGGGGEYRDERLKTYLKNIVIKIHGVSHRPNLPVDFAVQNTSVPNAWAIPGHVVMTRGLLAALDNEAEFVFVMGHEMGHVSARHSASQMSYGMLQQLGLGAAGLALSGTGYADPALALGSAGSSLLLLKYSRSDELEADRLGVIYMKQLGYDPRYAITAHRNLEKVANEYAKSMGKESQEGGFMSDLLSTHPRTSVRVEEIQQLAATTPAYVIVGDGANRERFQGMTAGLRKTNQAYQNYYDKGAKAMREDRLDEADALAAKALAADSNEAPFHTLKGFVALKRKDTAAAERDLKSALSLDQDYQPAYRGLGALLYMKQNYAGSMDYLKRALALFPQDAAATYFMGMDHYKLNSYKEAIPYLKAYAQANPKHPEVNGVLGICYEKTGDTKSAYAAYQAQVKAKPDSDLGRHANSRLGVLKP